MRADDAAERVVMQFGKAEQDAFILDFNPTGGCLAAVCPTGGCLPFSSPHGWVPGCLPFSVPHGWVLGCLPFSASVSVY